MPVSRSAPTTSRSADRSRAVLSNAVAGSPSTSRAAATVAPACPASETAASSAVPAYEATARLLRDGARPRAVICLNDRIALGVYQALQETGLVVPDDVSVVSFDDSDLARWVRPALTSVALPHAEMGRRAVELLLDGAPPTVARIPMPLAARSSVRSVLS